MLQDITAETLGHQARLALIPVATAEAAQAGADLQGQLLHPADPFLRQPIPNLAQGRIVEGIAGQAAAPFRVLGQQAGIHQLQEPAPVDLKGP